MLSVEERWKASKRLNDKRFDGVLFKNVLERDTLNTYEIKVRKDSGYGCWGEFSVRNIDNGVIRTAPFYIGNHTDLSNYLTKTVGFIALRKSDRPLTPHYNVADMLLDS
ncbi:hypothetical protein AB6A40_005303 [Gnathostoma spinigerum]|uniref:DNA ligase n=1 Tax=Gnathostoma spinigerum TaxID=75299 RepID=A0ABD6EKB0_9BILA